MGQGCIQSLRDNSCVDRSWDVDLHNDDNDFGGRLLLRHFGCKDVAVDAFAPDCAVTRRYAARCQIEKKTSIIRPCCAFVILPTIVSFVLSVQFVIPRLNKPLIIFKMIKHGLLQLAHSLLHLFFHSLVGTHDRLFVDNNFRGIGSGTADS